MQKFCNSVQYNDYEGVLYADKLDTKNTFKLLADEFGIKVNNQIIGIQFYNGDFILLELLEENSDVCKVKKHYINLDLNEFQKFFKRFSFCLTYKKYLESEYISE